MQPFVVRGKRRRVATAGAAGFDAELPDDDDGDNTQGDVVAPAARPDDPVQSKRAQDQGVAHAEASRWADALRCFDEAVLHGPNDAGAHEQRAQVLLELGENFRAVQAAGRAVQLREEWSEAWLTLARAQLNLGEPQMALKSAQHAEALGSDEAHDDAVHIAELVEQHRQAVQAGGTDGDAGHDADGGVSSDAGGEAMAQLAGLERNAAFAADRRTRCGIEGGDG